MESSVVGSSTTPVQFFSVGKKAEEKVHDVTQGSQGLTSPGKDRDIKKPVSQTDIPVEKRIKLGEKEVNIPIHLQTAQGLYLFKELEKEYEKVLAKNPDFSNKASVKCFNVFLDVLSRKCTYYANKPAKAIDMLHKAITIVEDFSRPGREEIVHCLKMKTLVLYLTPEAGDAIILEGFLELSENSGLEPHHTFDNVFQQLHNLVLINENETAFAAPLKKALEQWKENSQYRSTYGFPNTACMLTCLGINVSGSHHPVRKQVTRFDQFVQKMMDCNKHFYATMQPENYDDPDKMPSATLDNIKHVAVKMTKSLSDAGLLLDKSDFKFVKGNFDDIFGGFLNRFSSAVEDKFHKQLIADEMICYLHVLPDHLDDELNRTQDIKVKRERLEAVCKALSEKLYAKAIDLYDQVLFDIGGHFQDVTFLGTPVVAAEEQKKAWVGTLQGYLIKRGERFPGEASNHFETSVNVRITILKEIIALLQESKKKVSEIQQEVFHQPLVLKLMDKMRQEIVVVTGMISSNEDENKRHLLTVFRTCTHCIGSFIPAVKDEFGCAFLVMFEKFVGKQLVKKPETVSGNPADQGTTAHEEPAVGEEHESLIGSTEQRPEATQEKQQIFQLFYDACQEQPGLENVTVERVQKCKDMLDIMLSTNGEKTLLAQKDTLAQMLSLSEEQEPSQESYAKPKRSEMTVAQIDNEIKGWKIPNACRKLKEYLLAVNVTRDTLVPIEKTQRKDLIQMTGSAKNNLKFLCQAAMQKTKLALLDSMRGSWKDFSDLDKDRFIEQINFQIDNFDNVADLAVLDPFIWFCNALKEACEQKQSDLIKEIEQLHQKNLVCCANFFEKNYHGKEGLPWKTRAKECHKELTSFNDFILGESSGNNKAGQFINSAIVFFADNMTEVYQSQLAGTLPPSLETILMQQRVFSLSLSTHQPATAKDNDYDKFEEFVRMHNLHVKSLTEHFAHFTNRTNHPERNKQCQALDKSYHAAMMMTRDEALQKMGNAIKVLIDHKDGKDLLMQLHKAVSDLESSGVYNKFLKPVQLKIIKFFHWLVNFCIKHEKLVTGGFILGVLIIFIYQLKATEGMADSQKGSVDLLSQTGAVQSIYDQMVDICPELENAAKTLRSLPVSVAVDNLGGDSASCYVDIYSRKGSSLNVTLSEAFDQMHMTFIGLFGALFYSINDCPKGGYDSFIPGFFVNPGNFLLTIASIATGFMTMRGWLSAVDTFNREALSYSSLPSAAFSSSPDITERLMVEAKKYISNEGIRERQSMYAPVTTLDSCLDTMDTCFHKNSTCTPWEPLNKALSTIVDTIRYFTMMQGCSMSFPLRVHSLEDTRTRLLRLATLRKVGTGIRMLPYNFSKEFMDVTKTVGGTLVYLIVLKEVDVLVAFNEKANICNYERIKIMHEKLIECLNAIAVGKKLNTYQKAHLDAIYGKDLMDELLGANVDLDVVKGQAMIEASRWIRQITGGTFVALTVVGEVASKYLFTYSPYAIAKKAVEFMSGERPLNPSTKRIYQKLLEKAKSTIRKEFDPSVLSDEDLLVHYLSAGRSMDKITSSFLHWGIKEFINLSLYLNGTAAERSLGISSLNWNLLGLLIAYLVKDSTGMFARFAMLLEQEEFRTILSLADKLDSPFAEMFHHEIGKFGLSVSQHIINLVEPIIFERYKFYNGNLNDLHQSLASVAKHIDSRGLKAILHATKVEESVIQETMQEAVIPWAEGHEGALRNQHVAVKSARLANELPPLKIRPLEQLRIRLLEELKVRSVFHGKLLSSADSAKLAELENALKAVQEGKHGVDLSKAQDVLHLLFEMAKHTSDDIQHAYIEKHMLRPFHLLPAAESVQELIQQFSDDILNAHRKQTGVVMDMPSTSGTVSRQPVQMRDVVGRKAPQARISEARLSALIVDEMESVV